MKTKQERWSYTDKKGGVSLVLIQLNEIQLAAFSLKWRAEFYIFRMEVATV